MPAFLDAISGAGWVRGFLPLFNRFGQSVPPLLASGPLRNSRSKRPWLVASTLGMGLPMLIIGLVWLFCYQKPPTWLWMGYLLMYGLFFASAGINQLSFGTLQGKLIRPHRRGRLLGIGGMAGSLIAATAAFLWLGEWLNMPENFGFVWIFCVVGVGLSCSSIVLWWVIEPESEVTTTDNQPSTNPFLNAARTIARDRHLLRTVIVAMLFSLSSMIFPHYQWLGRHHLGLTENQIAQQMMYWVIVQNLSVGLFSLFAGTIADRFGNRLALQIQVFGCSLAPLTAIGMTWLPEGQGANWFWLTYVLLALVPVTMKTLVNYTLELAHEEDHPRYVSAVTACMALPFIGSPLLGLAVDRSVTLVFLGGGTAILCGFLLALTLPEPRHWADEHRSGNHHIQEKP